MKSGFVFGNKATWDLSMYVERLPAQNAPARKMETVKVPGRNGDLHLLQEAFGNYAQSYSCYFHGALPTPAQSHAVKAWLLSSGEYQRLEDTYDPEHFRLAAFNGPLNIENILNKYGRCTINFDCDPRCFLKSGEKAVTFTDPGQILNPTEFTALPLITVYGNSSGTVAVGNITVTIHSISGSMILDCENQNGYSQPGEGAPQNMNNCITAIPFPVLRPGSNQISFTGGITKIEIIPRWWEL